MTVGLSNLVSGATGGYTGSYIFSQTIFTLRAGITKSRACGYTVVFLELIIFLVSHTFIFNNCNKLQLAVFLCLACLTQFFSLRTMICESATLALSHSC